MLRYSEMLELPIVCSSSGKKVGDVKDILFSNKKFVALVVEEKGWVKDARIIRKESIYSIGRDAVIVKNDDCIEMASSDSEAGIEVPRSQLMETRVYTHQGINLGFIRDILFDFETGTIEGFELSDGLFQDILTGRHLLPLLGKVEFGDESIFVGREAIEEMIHDGRGLKNILQNRRSDGK